MTYTEPQNLFFRFKNLCINLFSNVLLSNNFDSNKLILSAALIPETYSKISLSKKVL